MEVLKLPRFFHALKLTYIWTPSSRSYIVLALAKMAIGAVCFCFSKEPSRNFTPLKSSVLSIRGKQAVIFSVNMFITEF